MATEFNKLLASIRIGKTYAAVKNRLDFITQKKNATDDPLAKRALRDAEVYALVWGVAVAARDDGAASIAIDTYDQGDDTVYTDLIQAQQNVGETLEIAIAAVETDAKVAASGNASDAVADANAADEAYRDAQPFIASLAGSQINDESIHLVLQVQEFVWPVRNAAEAYLNDHVERARLAETLKGLLNTYLLVWRKTTTGGGNPLAAQGILESIDEKNGTFVLKSTVYSGRRDTVAISDINSLDTSRSGPGARQSAVTPGWRNVGLGEWVRSDQY